MGSSFNPSHGEELISGTTIFLSRSRCFRFMTNFGKRWIGIEFGEVDAVEDLIVQFRLVPRSFFVVEDRPEVGEGVAVAVKGFTEATLGAATAAMGAAEVCREIVVSHGSSIISVFNNQDGFGSDL
jgi:hypothetical protein